MKKLLPFLLAAILVFPAFTTQKAPVYKQMKVERPAHHYAMSRSSLPIRQALPV